MSNILQTLNDQFNALPLWAKAVVGTTTAVVGSYFLLHLNRQRASPYKKDFVPGVVYVYQFPRSHFAPSLSPFSLKLETWLRIEHVKYENVAIPLTVRSKEGTLPFVELDGQEYHDSGFIIRDLTRLFNKTDKDEQLANEQRAVARAFEQMAENSTIWSAMRPRFMDKWNEFMTKEILGKELSSYVKYPFVGWMLQSRFQKRMIAHGIGRHTDLEIDEIGREDLKAVSNYLGVKRFFLGENAHRIDAVLFSLLAQIVYCPVVTPHKEYVEKECQNLLKYCDRIKDKFWPDWNEICEKLLLNTSYNLK